MENNEIKKFDEYILKCACIIQDYLCYIFNKKKKDLFEVVYTKTVPSVFIDTESKTKYKLKIDLVNKNNYFNLSIFNKKVVVDEMQNIANHATTIVWSTIKSLLNVSILDYDDIEFINGSQLIIDPNNTTMILYNKKFNETYSKHIRDNIEKRIGFVWCD